MSTDDDAEDKSDDEEDEMWGSTEARRTWRAAVVQVGCVLSLGFRV